MAYAFVDKVSAQSAGGNGFTTGTMDSTGADFLVAVLSQYVTGSTGSVSDSKTNAWTALTEYQSPDTFDRVRIFYARPNPTTGKVGTGHTFTVTVTAGYPTLIVAAFSGSDVSPFDSPENGTSNSGSGTSLQPGSITPDEDNELIITGLMTEADTTSTVVPTGYTSVAALDGVGGAAAGGGMAYKIQTTKGAENPSWTWTNTSSRAQATIAGFKIPSVATGRFLPTLGVGR